MSKQSQSRFTTVLVFLGLIVISWRAVTMLGYLGYGAADTLSDSTIIRMAALGLMGLIFVASGLVAWFRVRSDIAALFALYCIFYGMHWGGAINAESLWLENSFRLLHLVLSGILSQAFLLHFSATFFAGETMHRRRILVFILYAPAALAVGIMMFAIAMQTDVLLFERLENLLQFFESIFTNAYFLASAVIIWTGWWRGDNALRAGRGLTLMAGGLSVAILPYLTSLIVNAIAPAPWIYKFGTAPYTLFFSIIPITFLLVVLKNDRYEAPQNQKYRHN